VGAALGVALYLTLFIAGATIAVDLIVVLTAFLRGEDLTSAFLLKVAIVLLVTAGGFMHFLADLWGYWEKNAQRARMINYAVGVLIAVTIIAGFFIVGTPQHARLMRFDSQKVSDLQSIQGEVVNYYQQKGSLPADLSALNDPLSYFTVPSDPQSGTQYEYAPTGPLAFMLCAQFNAQDSATKGGTHAMMPTPYGTNDNWQHGEGRQCFTRTIDPERYPPVTKPLLQ
jgi:hypothetical protein